MRKQEPGCTCNARYHEHMDTCALAQPMCLGCLNVDTACECEECAECGLWWRLLHGLCPDCQATALGL